MSTTIMSLPGWVQFAHQQRTGQYNKSVWSHAVFFSLWEQKKLLLPMGANKAVGCAYGKNETEKKLRSVTLVVSVHVYRG